MSSKSFKDLVVWQKSFALAEDVYELCLLLPRQESFGVISQMQRSAVSIPSNIAEGQQRAGVNEFKQFISIAQGSAAELETQLLLVGSIYNIDASKLIAKVSEVQKMLAVLRTKI